MRPGMFKVQRRIFAEQLELRFKVDGTPDKHTLLALKLDPSVNTTQEDGIFSKRTAAQLLMVGEYRRWLVRRHKLMVAAVGMAGSAGSSALVPAKRLASSTGATGGVAKKGPASVLSRVNNANSGQNTKTVRTDPDTDNSLDIIKLDSTEEAKYASICVSVLANPQPYMVSGIFDLSVFWSGQKTVIPVHYSLWMAEGARGCAKVASANVETVFSGAGCISMKSHCLGPQILSDYAFLHYNYKYDWLRPTLEEIVEAYTKLYGKESRESDIESEGSSAAEEVEEDGDSEEEEGR